MGFLKRLFASAPSFQDRVWMTSERKSDDAIQRIARDSADESITCLAVYHFPETGDRLRSRLEEKGLACNELRRPGSDLLESLPTRLGAAVFGLLRSDEVPYEIKRGQGRRSSRVQARPCHVHLVEHYPLPYRDEHVLNLHAILPEGSAFFCYAALDEPWLDRALGSSTRALMEQLGMSDSEPLDQGMIGKALRRVQAQLRRKLRRSEQHADSLQEWARKNLSD